jgi:hypothetical protein
MKGLTILLGFGILVLANLVVTQVGLSENMLLFVVEFADFAACTR